MQDDELNMQGEEEEVLTPAEEGEHSVGGSAPSTTADDDVGEIVEGVIGNEPEPGKPFSLVEEVEKDEKALRDIPPDEADIECAVEDKDKFADE